MINCVGKNFELNNNQTYTEEQATDNDSPSAKRRKIEPLNQGRAEFLPIRLEFPPAPTTPAPQPTPATPSTPPRQQQPMSISPPVPLPASKKRPFYARQLDPITETPPFYLPPKAQKPPTSITYKGKTFTKSAYSRSHSGTIFTNPESPKVALKHYEYPNKHILRNLKRYKQLNALVDFRILMAQIYNPDTALKDGYIAREQFDATVGSFFKDGLGKDFKFENLSLNQKIIFSAYIQLIRDVLRSGVKNLNLNPNNIGIRMEHGKPVLCIIDDDRDEFYDERVDDTLFNIADAISSFTKKDPAALRFIAKELGLNKLPLFLQGRFHEWLNPPNPEVQLQVNEGNVWS